MKGSSLNSISAHYEVDYERTYRKKRPSSVAQCRRPKALLQAFLRRGDRKSKVTSDSRKKSNHEANSVAYDKRAFEAFGEERTHLGRLIASDKSPMFVPKRPKKKVTSRDINFSRKELKFRKTDDVFIERYGSTNQSTERSMPPLKNKRHFIEKRFKELYLLEYNDNEWNPSGAKDNLLFDDVSE